MDKFYRMMKKWLVAYLSGMVKRSDIVPGQWISPMHWYWRALLRARMVAGRR